MCCTDCELQIRHGVPPVPPLWTPASPLVAKIFKWQQREDKLSSKEYGGDGWPAPLLGTKSNMCTVCPEGQTELQSLALLQ